MKRPEMKSGKKKKRKKKENLFGGKASNIWIRNKLKFLVSYDGVSSNEDIETVGSLINLWGNTSNGARVDPFLGAKYSGVFDFDGKEIVWAQTEVNPPKDNPCASCGGTFAWT